MQFGSNISIFHMSSVVLKIIEKAAEPSEYYS